jgi:hypothetical protein
LGTTRPASWGHPTAIFRVTKNRALDCIVRRQTQCSCSDKRARRAWAEDDVGHKRLELSQSRLCPEAFTCDHPTAREYALHGAGRAHPMFSWYISTFVFPQPANCRILGSRVAGSLYPTQLAISQQPARRLSVACRQPACRRLSAHSLVGPVGTLPPSKHAPNIQPNHTAATSAHPCLERRCSSCDTCKEAAHPTGGLSVSPYSQRG